jgi:predicted nucleic acid-binding protein
MRVCFDSNVVIDIMGKSKERFASLCAYDVVLNGGHEPVIPLFTTTDIVYVLRRSYLGTQKTKEALNHILTMFELLDGHPLDCKRAHESDMPDYEDALIAFAAQRQGVDFIVTRNKRDFAHSPIPALTPEEFVKLLKPKSFTYTEVDYPQTV